MKKWVSKHDKPSYTFSIHCILYYYEFKKRVKIYVRKHMFRQASNGIGNVCPHMKGTGKFLGCSSSKLL